MDVAKAFGEKLRTVRSLQIDAGALYVLADQRVPESSAITRSTEPKQAMIVAKLLLKSNQTQQEAADEIGDSQQRIAKAAVVIEHAPDLVDEVSAGTMGLAAAYEQASARKKEKQGRICEQEDANPSAAPRASNSSPTRQPNTSTQ